MQQMIFVKFHIAVFFSFNDAEIFCIQHGKRPILTLDA